MRLQNQMRLQDQFRGVLPSATRATADQMLADIRELAPDITARIAEMETERRMPLDLVETLRSIGLFRIFAPRSHGGLELDFPTGLEIIGALARIDGSVGWTAMIGCVSAIFLPSLPRATYDQIYPQRAGCDCRRLGNAGRNGGGRGRGLARQRPLALRQRLPACRCLGRFLRHDRRRQAASGSGRRGRAAPGAGRGTAGARLADRGYLACRGTQGDRKPSHPAARQADPPGEFLRPGERRALPAGAALSNRAALPPACACRVQRRHGRGRAGRACRACQYRPAAASGTHAHAPVGSIPSRARARRSRGQGGAGVVRGPGREPLASRGCGNAQGRGASHAGHAGRDMGRHHLRPRRGFLLHARRRRRAL